MKQRCKFVQLRRSSSDLEFVPLDDVAPAGSALTEESLAVRSTATAAAAKERTISAQTVSKKLAPRSYSVSLPRPSPVLDMSRARGGEVARFEGLQQLHALADCSSLPLRIAFGVAEEKGVPRMMEDRVVTVMGMEALAAGTYTY